MSSEKDTYIFNAMGGDTIYINMMASWAFNPITRVYRPNGTLLTEFQVVGTGFSNETTFIIPSNGTYILLFGDKEGDNTGTYNLYIQRLNNPGFPPVANFTASVTSGRVPLTVGFNDTSTDTPTNWNWSFGDGNYSSFQNPVHTYGYAGLFTVRLDVSNADGDDSLTRINHISVTANKTAKIGVVRNNITWLLDASGNGAYGAGDMAYTFGKASDVYIPGDWNTDGKTEIGVVRNNITWLLDASGNGVYGAGDLTYTFGKAGDVYITGDWNKDGKTEIGVVRNSNTWLLDASGNGVYGAGDLTYTFGKAGDVFVTGDWNADGKTEIGVVRSGNTWLLDASGNGAYGAGDYAYTFGKAGDKPVTGKWI
jgi:PKD repeat protein